MNKQFRIWAGRGTMLGDVLATLPVATFCKKYYPDCHITWAMGKNSGQAAMLYLNNPYIDSIYICEGAEGPTTENDIRKRERHDIVFDVNPNHPDNVYPSERNIYLESFLMAGLSKENWGALTLEEQNPQLVKWWNPVKRPFGDKKTIFFTGMPNFGRESKRWVTKKYLEDLVLRLTELGYCVVQSGGEQDESWFSSWDPADGLPINDHNYKRINELSFFDQIKIANECDLIIGSDSGASLICGAYSLQQISLMPIHWGNVNNPSALSTSNPNNYSFYSIGGRDNISMDAVIDKVKEKIGLAVN